MRQRPLRSGVERSPNRRITLVAIAVTCLLVVAAAVAVLIGRGEQHGTPSSAPQAPRGSVVETTEPAAEPGSIPRPPKVSDPLRFAEAAARMLWSYDTRTTGHEQQLAGMEAWMTRERRYRDWESVSAQVPDPLLWSRMADQDQRATATVAEARYPAAFQQALAEDPAAITQAYIYAVTVTGKQTIAWAGAGQGAEGRSITLAVQCRPSVHCSLVAIAPRVAP